jgi:hypothetical protein
MLPRRGLQGEEYQRNVLGISTAAVTEGRRRGSGMACSMECNHLEYFGKVEEFGGYNLLLRMKIGH